MNSNVPLFAIGTGPVGLAFAAEMAPYGNPCQIIDKAQGTKEISNALIGIEPPTLRFFSRRILTAFLSETATGGRSRLLQVVEK